MGRQRVMLNAAGRRLREGRDCECENYAYHNGCRIPALVLVLERDSKRELQDTRHVSSGREQEVGCAHIGVHAVPLGMVEDIECLRTELNLDILLGFEDLVHRRIEVGAMRHIETVPGPEFPKVEPSA